MGQVCSRIEIGRWGHFPEFRVHWQGIHSHVQTRNSSIHVYAEFCGPNDAINQFWGDIKDCAALAGVAAGIAAIAAGPEAALPAFLAAFEPCLKNKVGSQVASQIHVALSTQQEHDDDWH